MDKAKNYVRKTGKFLVAGSILGALIAGCGGGGSSSGPGVQGSVSSISGTAAAGAPVSKGVGYALDAATGTQIPFVTGTDGSYNVNLNGYNGPFLIHVRGVTLGGSPIDLYSLASSANIGKTVNVTPLSDVVVGYAGGMTTANIENTCTANQAACPPLLNGIIANLALSNSNIRGAIPAVVLQAFGVDPATFDAITTSFAATHSGVDGLLDALQVVPPVTAGTSYAINLNGATPTPLATVPVAGTATAPTTVATTLTAASPQILQAANLATALSEVQANVAAFNQSMTAAAPGFPASSAILAGLDPAFLMNGWNGTTFASSIANGQALTAGGQIISGAEAPYSGAPWGAATAPAASATFDANSCVTSLWTYMGASGLVTGMMKFTKTITNPTGCVGTWLIAGNQAQYMAELTPLFNKGTAPNGTTTYSAGFQLNTSADDTVRAAGAYANVTITGPGLTTKGNFAAKGAGTAVTVPITLVPPAGFTVAQVGQSMQNRINDPYYFSSVLEDCTALTPLSTATTPCYDSTAAVAGTDYVVKFNSGAAVVLETTQHRLVSSLAATSVPASWYPTITGVTPSKASLVPVNTASTVTTTWTLPAGASPDWGGIFLMDATGTTIWRFEQPATTATSNTINIPATAVTVTPTSGGVGIIAPIGGLKVAAQMSF